ncbi:MAG: helix-turn-helix domain-containing protein [Pseudomonadota bacterium]
MSGLYHRGTQLQVLADDFVLATAERFGRAPDEITGRRRDMPLARQRMLGMVAATSAQHLSLTAIGRAFDKDHTTVLHARKTVADQLAGKPEEREHLDAIRARAIELAMQRMKAEGDAA